MTSDIVYIHWFRDNVFTASVNGRQAHVKFSFVWDVYMVILVYIKWSTLPGVLWECVVKCILRQNAATWFPCYIMTSHVEWRHDTLNDVIGVQQNTTNTICAIDGANISHLRTRKCVFHLTMLCEEYTGNADKPFRGLLTWSFTFTKSPNKLFTAQISIV
jgi:hypothetical protein